MVKLIVNSESVHLFRMMPRAASACFHCSMFKLMVTRRGDEALRTLRARFVLRARVSEDVVVAIKVCRLDSAATSVHWRAGSLRSFTAIRKGTGLFCGSFLRTGEVLAYVGSIQTLKDLKDCPAPELSAVVRDTQRCYPWE